MGDNITGLHHITVIAGDPQENLDFYVGILGMRLVKKMSTRTCLGRTISSTPTEPRMPAPT